MDKKDLECFSYGIHIQNLTKKEIESVLKDYYHIGYLPKIPFLSKINLFKEDELIEVFYNWALYILLLNEYHLPLKGNPAESINPSLYLKDMIMLLYLYVINQHKALPSNELLLSSSTIANLSYIEQSGFGNILGLRRENKFKREKESKYDSKKVKYVATLPNEWTDYSTYSVIRNEKEQKYNIPYACKNVVEALIKSRKHNSCVFYAERNETLSQKEIEELYDKETSIEIFGIPLKIFEDNIRESFFLSYAAGGGAQKKLCDYFNQSIKDVNADKEYTFYKKYFKELNKSEKNWIGNSIIESKFCIEKANQYLSEVLFAYLYFSNTFQLIKKKKDKQAVNSDTFYNLLEIIYETSKSPACFSREGHINYYAEKFFSILTSENRKPEKDLYIQNERYTVHKFLPAFFYCLLYYLYKANIIKEEYNEENLAKIENYIRKYVNPLGGLYKKPFMEWLEMLGAKELWIKRRTDFFKPLDYEIEKALF